MLKKLTQKRNKKGFTLVELVVVIAILGILAAIAVPRLTGFKDNAGLAADKATAASIAKAADLYAASHNITGDKVTLAELMDEDLVEHTTSGETKTLITPQNSKGKSFVLTYDNNQFVVSYEEAVSGITVLYPEP